MQLFYEDKKILFWKRNLVLLKQETFYRYAI
jgi:hypothetical protein